MKRIQAALITHNRMLSGEELSSTEIGEISEHFHPANQVVDFMRHQLNLPVTTLGKGDDGKTYYGYTETEQHDLKVNPERVKEQMRAKNKQKRNQRHTHNVQMAIKELGIDPVNNMVKTAIMQEIFCSR